MTLLITAPLLQYCQKKYISSICASSSADSEIGENIEFLKVFPKKKWLFGVYRQMLSFL